MIQCLLTYLVTVAYRGFYKGGDKSARSGWPLTWKTWKGQGIPKWSGKSQGKWKKVRETEICFSLRTRWRVEVAAFGRGLWICSSLTLL